MLYYNYNIIITILWLKVLLLQYILLLKYNYCNIIIKITLLQFFYYNNIITILSALKYHFYTTSSQQFYN